MARMGYGSGNAMGAVFLGILKEDRQFNVEREGPQSKAKMGARFSQNIFDGEKIFFKDEDGEIKLYVSPQTKRDIENKYSELSSDSEDNLVWGCPSAFSRTGQGKIVLSDFSKLIYRIIRKTRL